MHTTEVTTAPCLVCGAGNTPDANGDRRQFVDLERDVNWNDPAMLCEDCALKVGALVGMLNPSVVRALRQQLKELEKAIHAKDADMDSMRRRAKRLGMEFSETVA